MDYIKQKYILLCSGHNSSDIYEHLPTLYNYAKECDSVFETGVRGCISSWAFLYGLINNQNNNQKRLFLNDINKCDINELLNSTNSFNNITINFYRNNII